MKKFHYGFALNQGEVIIHKGTANMHDSEYIISGALYLTDEKIIFIGYIPNSRNKVSSTILLEDVREVKTEKSLFVFNNILRIVDIHDVNYKFIVKGQQEWNSQILRQLGRVG